MKDPSSEPEKCEHGRPKVTCMECWRAENPDQICEHNQIKGACTPCHKAAHPEMYRKG